MSQLKVSVISTLAYQTVSTFLFLVQIPMYCMGDTIHGNRARINREWGGNVFSPLSPVGWIHSAHMHIFVRTQMIEVDLKKSTIEVLKSSF